MKFISRFFFSIFLLLIIPKMVHAQLLRLPDPQVTNLICRVGRTVGVTDILITYNAPAMRGRDGSIWGTTIVPYGYTVLGFGSIVESPWRAGANESTTMSFSTDVLINGKKLPAGTYGFFMAVYADSTVLIFNKNVQGWGSYFYDSSQDIMHVTTRQQKNQPQSKERLEYNFQNQTDRSVEVALEWEKWRIPFKVEVDLIQTTLGSIQTQMSGAMGFDPASLQAAADWCLNKNINLDQATTWITSATSPSLGGVQTYAALTTQSGLLAKSGKKDEADKIMAIAIENASSIELHGHGRRLLASKKPAEAMAIFEKNYKKYDGKWPTAVGMMRGLSATGKLTEALKYAKIALTQAPDDINKKNLEASIKTLEGGNPL